MKNRPLALVFIAIVVLIIIIIAISGIKSVVSQQNASRKSDATSESVSSDTIYFQGPIAIRADMESKTNNDQKYPSLSVYWVKGTTAYSNDTCTLYDNVSNLIYATRYHSSQQIGGASSGSMYYINKNVKQDKATSLLDNLCFKDL